MAIQTVIHTNQQSIERVLQTGLPLILVFWQRTAPLSVTLEEQLAQAAAQYAGKLLIAKIDAEAEPSLVQRFQVRQIPSLLFLQAAKVVGNVAGNVSPNEVAAWLNYLLHGGERPAPATNTTQAGSSEPITLTAANFDQIINGSTPVLVDFWAPWCGPCRMVAPAVEQVARQFQGRAVVGKLNVDEVPQIAQRYQIRGIPALYIFQRGKVVDQMVGVQSAQTLHQHLQRFVSG